MRDSTMPNKSPHTGSNLHLIIPEMTHAMSQLIIEESDSSSATSTPSTDLDGDSTKLYDTRIKNINFQQRYNEKPLSNLMYNSDDLESCDSSHESENSIYSDDSVPSSANCDKIINLDHQFQTKYSISNKCNDIIEKFTNFRVLESNLETETAPACSCKKSNSIQEKVENFRNENENLKNANSSAKHNDTLSETKRNSSKDLTLDTDDDDDDLVQRAPMKAKSRISAFKPYDTLSNGFECEVKEIYADDNNRIRIDTSLNILLAEDWKNSENKSNYADISDNSNIQFNELDSSMNNLLWNCSTPVECEQDFKKNYQSNEEYHETHAERCPFTIIEVGNPSRLVTSNSGRLNNSLQIIPDYQVPQGPPSSSSMISYTSTIIPSPSNCQNIVDSPAYEPLFTEYSQSEFDSELYNIPKEDIINLNDLNYPNVWQDSINETEKTDRHSRRSSIDVYSNEINKTYIPCEIEDTRCAKTRIDTVSHNSQMNSNEQSSNCCQLSDLTERKQSNFSESIFQWIKEEDLPSFILNSPRSSEGSSTPIPPNDRSFLAVHTNMSKYMSNTDLNIPYGQQLTPINSPASSTVSSPKTPVNNLANVMSRDARSKSWSTPKYRDIAPWPTLNLPSTDASKRLKGGLDMQDVHKAMQNILIESKQYLTSSDNEKYTQLMLLVREPNFLKDKRNRAHLIPLVERIGDVQDNLLAKNNYGEDALYLAAMNCYEMPYVAGYLAAAMIKRHIDISKIVYHTKGDTLIHAVAAKGDTHINVLSELLSLKTNDNNYMFDLTTCNYDGKTALHVAVEAHKTSKPRISSIGTVLLLLKRGVNPKIKEALHGNTALHLAVDLNCDPNLIKALLSSKGYDAINIRNNSGNTPVHLAAKSQAYPAWQREVCRYLLGHKGLTNIRNNQGETPLALVSPDRHEAIKKIFYQKM